MQVFQDVLGVESFTGSEEAFAADALLLAYKEGNAEQIKAVVQVRALCHRTGTHADTNNDDATQGRDHSCFLIRHNNTLHCDFGASNFELENDMVV